jgi:HK97 family phage portal protein
MGVLDRFAHLLLREALPPTPEPRLIAFGTTPGLAPWGLTETSALGLSAVNRAVSVIAGAVAGLAWGEWRQGLELPPSRIVTAPSESLTRREWAWRVAATMALYDAAFVWRVGGRDLEGVPFSLLPIPPQAIAPNGPVDSWGLIPPSEYRIGSQAIVPADEVLIIRRSQWPTVPDHLAGLIRLARVSLGSALAAEGYASRYWQAGGSPQTILTTEAELVGNQAADIAEQWRQRRSQGPDYPAVLGKGASANEYGADPTQASAVEARREMVADIGRYFGVPTHMLNAPSGDPTTYRTTESEGLSFIRYSLADYIGAIEDAISGELPPGRLMRIDPTPLTRGEQLTRYQAWESALRAGWITTAEVRDAEGYPPQELPAPAPVGAPAIVSIENG